MPVCIVMYVVAVENPFSAVIEQLYQTCTFKTCVCNIFCNCAIT